jgi:chemosensory pili system protein ChpA (sensor histidine kinase/response regulator)
MDRPVNPGVASSFIGEAMSYLPRILEVLEPGAAPLDLAALEEAYRLVHTIKGSSSIVGFSALSELAGGVEDALEQVVAGHHDLDTDRARALQELVCGIGAELDRLAMENGGLSGTLTDDWGDDPSDAPAASPRAGSAQGPASDPLEIDIDDAVPAELMEVFMLEAQDHLQIIARTLSILQEQPDDRDTLQELRRSVHTLKGAAGMVGFRVVGQLAHRMEDLLDALYDGHIAGSAGTTSLLFASADVLHQLVAGEGDTGDLHSDIQGLYLRFSAMLPAHDERAEPLAPAVSIAPDPVIGAWPAPQTQTQAPGASTNASAAPHAPAASPAPSIGTPAGPGTGQIIPRDPRRGVPAAGPGGRKKAKHSVRVDVGRLDELISLVGELVINRSSLQQYLSNLTNELDELGQSVSRLRLLWSKLETEYEIGMPAARSGRWVPQAEQPASKPAAHEAYGFDELEFDHYTESHLLSRQLSEVVGDIDAVQRQLRDSVSSFDGDFSRMKRLTTDAQERLLQLRMVPIGTLTTKLERVVRVTAENLGKAIEFVVEGEQVALDRPILDELGDAMLHLLRNAVDHGIERPDARRASGKPERARVLVRARYDGAHAIIQVVDDGRGLDLEALRNVARREGYATGKELEEMSERDLHMLIFRPKFSTAHAITDVSGRGVGLDVVKEKIQQLNGTVNVESAPGRGVTFTVRLPLTLAVARVLLVRAGRQTFAMPATAIGRVLRLDKEDIESDGNERRIKLEGQAYNAVHLLNALGARHDIDDNVQRLSALILNAEWPTALIVDQFLEARDVVVTMLSGHLRKIHGLAGATVLGDGTVVIILNPEDLVEHAAMGGAAEAMARPMVPEIDRESVLRILVVDDSLSVRQVLAGLVRRQGWTPLLARDGLEALEILQREAVPVDLIFSDVEMPRMDGYELASAVRADAKFKQVPLVFITSRAGEKHRRRGFEVGASGYLVKPFDEHALLELIERLVGGRVDGGHLVPPVVRGGGPADTAAGSRV